MIPRAPTQEFLEFDQIRENVIVLKDRSLRGVMMVSSLNFALKSEEERNIVISQFQDFLNSLDFSVQILVQTKRLNITGYLDKLKEIEESQQNELLKMQITEYRNFIGELIGGGQIFTKNFYVIVPFYFLEIPGLTKSKDKKAEALTEERFQRAKTQLWERMEFVAAGLGKCGLQCMPLNTSQIIELLWALYHPEEAEVGYYPEIPPEMTR
jgi:type IV secretory pathway VirB4 component